MSMELIDSNKLIDYFFYGIDEKPITGSTETDEKVIQVIQSQEIVKAIPLDKVEQIKEEISKCKTEHELQISERDTKGKLMISDIFCDVIEIIDKALKEQTT